MPKQFCWSTHFSLPSFQIYSCTFNTRCHWRSEQSVRTPDGILSTTVQKSRQASFLLPWKHEMSSGKRERGKQIISGDAFQEKSALITNDSNCSVSSTDERGKRLTSCVCSSHISESPERKKKDMSSHWRRQLNAAKSEFPETSRYHREVRDHLLCSAALGQKPKKIPSTGYE